MIKLVQIRRVKTTFVGVLHSSGVIRVNKGSVCGATVFDLVGA